MTGSGRWAITVTEVEPEEFHFTVLEAVSDDADLFTFEPGILDDTPYATAIAAWVAGVCALCNYESDCIHLPAPRWGVLGS